MNLTFDRLDTVISTTTRGGQKGKKHVWEVPSDPLALGSQIPWSHHLLNRVQDHHCYDVNVNSQFKALSKEKGTYAPRYYYRKENGKGTQTFRKHKSNMILIKKWEPRNPIIWAAYPRSPRGARHKDWVLVVGRQQEWHIRWKQTTREFGNYYKIWLDANSSHRWALMVWPPVSCFKIFPTKHNWL